MPEGANIMGYTKELDISHKDYGRLGVHNNSDEVWIRPGSSEGMIPGLEVGVAGLTLTTTLHKLQEFTKSVFIVSDKLTITTFGYNENLLKQRVGTVIFWDQEFYAIKGIVSSEWVVTDEKRGEGHFMYTFVVERIVTVQVNGIWQKSEHWNDQYGRFNDSSLGAHAVSYGGSPDRFND